MIKIKIGLTGHRTERLKGKEQEVKEWIHRVLDIFLEGPNKVELLCGCADGADEIFGLCAYDNNDIDLTLVLPFYDYRINELGMNKLSTRANRRVSMAPEWDKDVDSLRDRYIAYNCDVLLAVWDGNPSKGVCETIEYAKAAGKVIIYCPRNIFKETDDEE